MAGEQAFPAMDSLLECAICLGNFTDPRTLPCLHTYCLDCLGGHMESSAVRGRFHCPACRKTCAVPLGGVKDFPKNFFVNTMISSLEDKKKKEKDRLKPKVRRRRAQSQNPTVCANSEEGEAHLGTVAFCTNCEEYLCKDCYRGHRRYKATRQHKVVPITEEEAEEEEEDEDSRDTDETTPRCPQHHQPLMLYCTDCKTVLCSQCFESGHKNHKCQELSRAARTMRTRLKKMEKFLGDCGPRYNELLQGIQQKRKVFLSEVGQARQELDSSLEAVFILLQEKRTALKEEFDTTAQETFVSMQSSEDQVRMASVKTESIKSHISQVISGDVDDVALLQKAPEMLELVDELQQPLSEATTCRVHVNKQSIHRDALDSLVGQMKSERKERPNVAHSAEPVAESDRDVDHLPERLTLVDTINVWASVIAMAASNGKLYYVQDKNPPLVMYDAIQRTFHPLQIPGVKQPSTLTIAGEGVGILITEGQGRRDYNVTWGSFALLGAHGDIVDHTAVTLSGFVTGVSSCCHGNLLVTSVGPKQLATYSVHVEGAARLTCDEVIDLTDEHYSKDIKAVESGDNFAVLDAELRRITWVDKTGTSLYQFELTPLNQAQQRTELATCYITNYKREYLLLTDAARGVTTVINHDMTMVVDILGQGDGVYNPRVTHWDSARGELYVAQVDVQFRPPYHRGTSTPLINVYALPGLRDAKGHQPQHQLPTKSASGSTELTVTLTLPRLTESDTVV